MCGILGLCLADQTARAGPELYDGALFLQHRGQDAAGITTSGPGGRFYQCKGNGMAREVFTQERLAGLVGNVGIAHLRYPTAGSSSGSEAQPFYVNSPYGISLAHNGNLVNTKELRKFLDEEVHRHINTDSDSELLLNIFANELDLYNKARVNNDDIFHALEGMFKRCRGAYACVGLLAGYGMFAFRDPNGIRPVLFGERINEDGTKDHMVASESVVLKAHNFKTFRDLMPGEAVIVQKTGKVEFRQVIPIKNYTPDIFEYVYFARPDSILDGISVYHTRLEMGAKLATHLKEKTFKGADISKEIDVVIPIPDTSRNTALECAAQLKLPFREGFVKNTYVGRTFIMADQKKRVSSVRRKLNAMESEFKGRNVLLVDDSIVRGTTSKEIIQMAREAGANKVYFASAAPAIRHNHIYGIDLADTRALVAFNRTEAEVAEYLGADKVVYQTLEDLLECVQPHSDKITGFEVGVFNGDYITGVEEGYLEELEQMRARNKQLNGNAKAEVDIGIYNLGDYK
ncbi:CYFA0S08e00144g1_1 [Cyberlindnera fabianii]|uniref:Amidophosphoribosyltransferase n=1 Tax=Cyberlindnera fabianii TaxID=36022 RepID=A0A061B297_CYBFA|nr:CYFA0S08e00144g1_1 [Cyberlindnera fabianii]